MHSQKNLVHDMYPPPPKETLQDLLHSNLEVVSFGQYVIHFSFENKNVLSVSAPFRFGKFPLSPDAHIFDFPLAGTELTRLLGFQITQVECDIDGTLELQFSNGDVLIVYANDPAYEAYTVLINGKEYIV
jgi:hypothetical protein